MADGERQYPHVGEQLFQLREDFESFRKTVMQRLDFLQEALPPSRQAELRLMIRNQEIEDFRNGR